MHAQGPEAVHQDRLHRQAQLGDDEPRDPEIEAGEPAVRIGPARRVDQTRGEHGGQAEVHRGVGRLRALLRIARGADLVFGGVRIGSVHDAA
jgi:hypothetical protein